MATPSCSTYITEHKAQTVGGPLGYYLCGCCTGYIYAQLSYSKHFMVCVNVFQLADLYFPGQGNGPIRLWRSGTTSISYTSGRVQVYYNSRWGNICDQFGNSGLNEATVICHQLGYAGASSWSKTSNDS